MKTPATCPSTKAISPTSRPPKFRPNILTGARITATTITSKAQSRLPQRKRSRPKTRRNAELLKNVENWLIQLIIVIKLINLIQLLLIFFLHEKIVDRLLQFIKWNFYRGYMFIVSFNKIFFLKNVWFNIFLYNAQIFKMATPGADTEAFAFSPWLAETHPKKTPYYPQLGDILMYFRQGHEKYIDLVKERNEYKINPREVQWHKKKTDSCMVKVTGIRFEIRPPRLVVLKLAILDQSTGNLVGDSFTIKYHDMNDVVDFLVLHQQYSSYRGKHWKKG